MNAKCSDCGTHHDPADEARCRNARDLGLKLNARLNVRAVPRACERVMHERYSTNATDFLIHFHQFRERDNGSMRFLVGVCLHCGNEWEITIGSVFAAEAMRARP